MASLYNINTVESVTSSFFALAFEDYINKKGKVMEIFHRHIYTDTRTCSYKVWLKPAMLNVTNFKDSSKEYFKVQLQHRSC